MKLKLEQIKKLLYGIKIDYGEEHEKRFSEARKKDCSKLILQTESLFNEVNNLLDNIENNNPTPESKIFDKLENKIFNLAPLIGACTSKIDEYIILVNRLRNIVKANSRTEKWSISSNEFHKQRLYRLLYGSRAALEEVMLQTPKEKLSNLVNCKEVKSSTPSASIFGTKIHSGDILISRGGAPTSALISRGNDYPGNFSHIALVYIDPKTHLASIIESHIEIGVAIANLEQYIKDTKLRVMLMRLREDHPAIIDDPQIPHKAAKYALDDANARHIPYDFEMDFKNSDKLFCSEVASAGYEKFGINLWMSLSSISDPGVINWLSEFGVENFFTQEPADLEYDPQLEVVAEWRDHDILYKDHIDNAVIDVMLEDANRGELLDYNNWLLPLVRILKGYSFILNQFEISGPVPEGMSATAALKNESFSHKHDEIKKELMKLAAIFEKEKGYIPPYWQLLKFARESKKKIEG